MPLSTAFEEKLDEIRTFIESGPQRLMAIQHDEDLRQPLLKMLLGLEDDPDYPHILVYSDLSYEHSDQYLEELLVELSSGNEELRDELAGADINLPSVPAMPPRKDRPPEVPAEVLASYQTDVAECLPDTIGSVVLVLEPQEVDQEEEFAWAILTLASSTESEWAKYIVLDRREDPMLANLEEVPDLATSVQFYISPPEIEERVNADLANGNLSPLERRQYTLMAGAFAASGGRPEEAEEHQLAALEMADEEGSPEEQANILYNLGNNYLEQERHEEAEDAYLKSANICLEHEVNPLLALVLTNLGVDLFHLRRIDQSLESFDVARRTFKALNNPPGEAHALDNKARVLHAEGRLEEAEETWKEALEIYDGISAPHLQDVRQGGREDIIDKLMRFYEKTNQKEKRAALASEDR
jgi:tetratricopeptide (TPR) repeat protein